MVEVVAVGSERHHIYKKHKHTKKRRTASRVCFLGYIFWGYQHIPGVPGYQHILSGYPGTIYTWIPGYQQIWVLGYLFFYPPADKA